MQDMGGHIPSREGPPDLTGHPLKSTYYASRCCFGSLAAKTRFSVILCVCLEDRIGVLVRNQHEIKIANVLGKGLKN